LANASPAINLSGRENRSLQRALAAARVADANRGRDIAILDLREITPVFDYFVIVTGSSRRQLHAISEEIDDVMARDFADQRLGIEGYAESRWILLDFGVDDETRAYYDLENLWAGARRVPFETTSSDGPPVDGPSSTTLPR